MRKKMMSCCAALLACCMIAGCSGGSKPTGQNDSFGPDSTVDSPDEENYISTLTPQMTSTVISMPKIS